MDSDFLSDLQFQQLLVTGRFQQIENATQPIRSPEPNGDHVEWSAIFANDENHLEDEEFEEFLAPAIRGANDLHPSSMLIVHMGIGNTSFGQVENVFGSYGEIKCIDRNAYYAEKGYVAVIFAQKEDAIRVYNELNRAGQRVEKHQNRRIRCYYYEGDQEILSSQQTNQNTEVDSGRSSRASTSRNNQSREENLSPQPRSRIQSLVAVLENGNRSHSQPNLIEARYSENELSNDDSSPSRSLPKSLDTQRKNESISEAVNEIPDLSPGICKICTVKIVDISFIPCGHTTCSSCFAHLNESCPFCRLTVIHTNKIYLC